MRILLVEGDVLLSASLVKLLEANRYAIDLASDGETGLNLATTQEYDLLLLDVQLPRLDGVSLCRQLRSQGYRKPVLLMTASDSDAEVMAGFDAGADDYISKPCAPEVLLAKMRTWLRRSAAQAGATIERHSASLTWGDLSLDLDAGRVMVRGQVVPFTATEYNLLELFLRHPERIFSRSVILDRLWGLEEAPSDRAIVTHMKDVRKKLRAGGLTDEIIETVYGMGYRLKPAPSPTTAQGGGKGQTTSLPAPGQSAVKQVLERFRHVFNEQVTVLQRAKTALLEGQAIVDLQAARQEAHKLAGSLASFGYPEGSKLARSIEHLLVANPTLMGDDSTHFAELVNALQQDLDREPIAASISSPPSTLTHRVLVIDDDIALTERLKAEADLWGTRMKIAANLTEARSQLTLRLPDVVLLDLSFPESEEDGLTLLQEITQQFPSLPVVVFTGRGSLTDRLAVSRLGARQFLQKPATTEQIFQAIARVLSNAQKRSEAKVLIVDDDPGMLGILSIMLSPWGLDVVPLSDPQRFWEVLETTSPDLVLLDLEMPQINGLELCQVVRQDAQWENLPLLVVTAHTDADTLKRAFAAGADDFITKPVLGPELVTRVLSRLERTRLRSNIGEP